MLKFEYFEANSTFLSLLEKIVQNWSKINPVPVDVYFRFFFTGSGLGLGLRIRNPTDLTSLCIAQIKRDAKMYDEGNPQTLYTGEGTTLAAAFRNLTEVARIDGLRINSVVSVDEMKYLDKVWEDFKKEKGL